MSRWRPPAEKSSPYITPEGYRRLESEYKQLWDTRSEVTTALAAAAAEGDRSENAEYIYRKKQLRELDRRITYLQKRMPTLKVVEEVANTGKIYFACAVSLEDIENGSIVNYRIVGADEIDEKEHYISVDAPLSKAMLGKAVDDIISVEINGNQKEFIVLEINSKQSDL